MSAGRSPEATCYRKPNDCELQVALGAWKRPKLHLEGGDMCGQERTGLWGLRPFLQDTAGPGWLGKKHRETALVAFPTWIEAAKSGSVLESLLERLPAKSV